MPPDAVRFDAPDLARQIERLSQYELDTLPFAIDQLTWTFVDMTNDGGRMAIIWGKTMASTPFKAGAAR